MGTQPGKKNPNWRGGKSIASNGYMLVKVGKGHHLADVRGYAYEHRVAAEQKLGRRLLPGEQVHHRDENKLNNDLDNLEVCTAAEHHVRHRNGGKASRLPGESNPPVNCACGCGASFLRYDDLNRERRYVSGHNRGPRPTVDAVLRALEDGPKGRADVAKKTGVGGRAVSQCLSKLKRAGVLRNEHGMWMRND